MYADGLIKWYYRRYKLQFFITVIKLPWGVLNCIWSYYTNDLEKLSSPSYAFVQVLRTAVGHRLARVQGFLFKAAFLRRVPTFTRLIIENLMLCFLQSTLYQTSKYLTGSLSLRFKKILTDISHADYFEVHLLQFCLCLNFILSSFLAHTFLNCVISSEWYHEEHCKIKLQEKLFPKFVSTSALIWFLLVLCYR